MEKALFIQRLGAYIIDYIIIFIIGTLIASFIVDVDKINELNDKTNLILEEFSSGEITQKEYFENSIEVTYEIGKEQVVFTGIYIVIMLLYYVLFQLKNKGQTLGKKLLKIRVVGVAGDINIWLFLLRGLFVNLIFTSIVSFLIIIFGDLNLFNYYAYFEVLFSIILFVSMTMVVFRKDSRGLHDLFAKTEVVKI